jgi:hypothetical protein
MSQGVKSQISEDYPHLNKIANEISMVITEGFTENMHLKESTYENLASKK